MELPGIVGDDANRQDSFVISRIHQIRKPHKKERIELKGGLMIVVLAVYVLSGCIHDTTKNTSTPSGVDSSQKEPTPSADDSLFQGLTIKEAQEKVSFKILIPSHLPNGTVFQYAQVYDGAEFISEGKGKSVLLKFGNGTEGFSVQEQIGVMGQLNSGDVKKVTVNHTEAQFSNDGLSS